MRAVLVNCFDTYENNRVNLVKKHLISKGYEVTIVQSDFSHFHKVHLNRAKDDMISVETLPYKKNLSIERLVSHYKFSKDAFKIVEDLKPDLIYTLIPPNYLAKFAAAYKKKNPKVKLVLDLIDLWPETMPLPIKKTIFPLSLWGGLRDNYLKYSDLIITECDLYQEVLYDVLKDLRVKTLYLAKEEIELNVNSQLNKEEINLAYLGSINNIIDIPKITEIIEAILRIKPVTLNIIGDGEKKEELIFAVENIGAKVVDYGKIFDPIEKQHIFDKCHFGLNIMKSTVCVGLTMKSIDYFQHGLPIINNIPADTAKLVEEYGVGINLLTNEDIATKINEFNLMEISNNKLDATLLFHDKFSTSAFFDTMDSMI